MQILSSYLDSLEHKELLSISLSVSTNVAGHISRQCPVRYKVSLANLSGVRPGRGFMGLRNGPSPRGGQRLGNRPSPRGGYGSSPRGGYRRSHNPSPRGVGGGYSRRMSRPAPGQRRYSTRRWMLFVILSKCARIGWRLG